MAASLEDLTTPLLSPDRGNLVTKGEVTLCCKKFRRDFKSKNANSALLRRKRKRCTLLISNSSKKFKILQFGFLTSPLD